GSEPPVLAPFGLLDGVGPGQGEGGRRDDGGLAGSEEADGHGYRDFAPPSVLPDISPSRGEIRLPHRRCQRSKVGDTGYDSQSPPVWGRCPAGQRGAT